MASRIRIKLLNKDIKVNLNKGEITMSAIKSGFLLPPDAVVGLCYNVNEEKIWCE